MFSQIRHRKDNTENDWNTPKTAVDAIVHLVPQGSIVYEPFTNDTSKSHIYLHEHGFKTVSHIGDFYSSPPNFDIIVTNPPFSDIQRCLSRLFELAKPFIIIAPLSSSSGIISASTKTKFPSLFRLKEFSSNALGRTIEVRLTACI